MKIWLFIMIAGMILIIGACSDTFMVSKVGEVYFISGNSNAKFNLLCKTGDMEKILLTSHLDKEIKDALYQYTCSEARSGDKVKQIYASMNSEQRKDIKNAFRKNGYTINVCAT